MQNMDFINFKKYYQKASVQLPKDNFYQGFLSHKVKHSMNVLRIGQEIISHTSELNSQSDDFKLAAERALLFHDVGRFEEGVLRWQSEYNNEEVAASSLKFNHCDLGYNVLLKDKDYNDQRILAAVKFHGRMMEDVYASEEWQYFMKLPEKDEIKQILFLTRDADKLENLYTIKKEHHLYEDIFYKQLSEENRKAPLSAKVIEQFEARKTILFSTVVSFADRLLMVLSWIYDINYQASRKMCRQFGSMEYLLRELEKLNHDKNLQQKIVMEINKFYEI